MTPKRKAELEDVVRRMEQASNNFYTWAIRCGNHTFIEFCGLMNEYISVCRVLLAQDIDFTHLNKHNGQHLPAEPYFVTYLAEKLDCIFGPDLARQALETIVANHDNGNRGLDEEAAAVEEGPAHPGA